MLLLENVSGGYGPRPVIRNISFSLEPGKALAIFGPNTAGKTSIIRAIMGQLPNVSGSIKFHGTELLSLPAHKRASHGISLVPEGRHVFTDMSVEENLRVGAYWRRSEISQRDIDECFDLFPRLRERRRQSAGTLSGGEQQMVAIGRALMTKPQLLLLDEPSHGLAPLIVAEVRSAIARVVTNGLSVLLVEQSLPAGLPMISHGLLVEGGQVVLADSISNMTANEHFRQSYLGV